MKTKQYLRMRKTSPLLLFACIDGVLSSTSTVAISPTFQDVVADDSIGATNNATNMSPFQLDLLKPGELSEIQWKDGGESVSPFAVRVGVPDDLRSSMVAFLESTGLLGKIWDLEYNNELQPSSFEFINITRNGSIFSWHANRPNENWKSNMHWLQPSNEAAYENVLDVLAEGGFDVVLDAIGRHFDLDSLMIQGVGVVAVSHCTEGYVHYDMTGTGGKFFNVLVPLTTLPNAKPELILVDEKGSRGALKYIDNVAVVIGDDALHGTEAVDYRDQHDVRVTASIYIADVNTNNAETISYDDTALFPVPGDSEYLMANRGRHWGNGNSLTNDPGRRPFLFEDKLENCPELVRQGKCESDPHKTRVHCLASCGVYLPNSSSKTSKASSLTNSTKSEPNYLVQMLREIIATTTDHKYGDGDVGVENSESDRFGMKSSSMVDSGDTKPNYLVQMLREAQATSTDDSNEYQKHYEENHASEGGNRHYDRYRLQALENHFNCAYKMSQPRQQFSESTWYKLRQTYEMVVGKENSSLSPLQRKNGLVAPIEVRNDNIKGRGLYAAEFIAKGSIVWYPRNSAVFRDSHSFRHLLKSVPEEYACDVLMFSYVTYDNEDKPIIVTDLDEGAYFNSAASHDVILALEGKDLEGITKPQKPTEKNAIPLCLAEDEGVTVAPDEIEKYSLGVLEPFVARVNIPKGEELTLEYSDFCDQHGWRYFGL